MRERRRFQAEGDAQACQATVGIIHADRAALQPTIKPDRPSEADAKGLRCCRRRVDPPFGLPVEVVHNRNVRCDRSARHRVVCAAKRV